MVSAGGMVREGRAGQHHRAARRSFWNQRPGISGQGIAQNQSALPPSGRSSQTANPVEAKNATLTHGQNSERHSFPSKKFPMPEKQAPPRRPILTRKEQAVLAFLLALLVVGGIVRKLRMDWHAPGSTIVHKS
jgi:hypothetical protein